MKINGTNFSTYGLILIDKNGFYNMPSRIGNVVYDWGDEIQPLLSSADISFGALLLTANFFFDQRRTANTLEQTITTLKGLGESIISLDEGNGTTRGVHNVVIERIDGNINYKTGSKITITFYERTPTLNGTIPSTPTSLNNILHFGGYNFSQFNIAVSKVTEAYGAGILKDSKRTTANGVAYKLPYRDFRRINLECYLVAANRTEMLTKMESFKALLGSSGQKALFYKGKTMQTFYSETFTVEQRRRHLRFTLNLNIIE